MCDHHHVCTDNVLYPSWIESATPEAVEHDSASAKRTARDVSPTRRQLAKSQKSQFDKDMENVILRIFDWFLNMLSIDHVSTDSNYHAL